MIVKACKHFGEWAVRLEQDHQTFFIDMGDLRTKEEAEWFARQFKVALKRHNAEVKSSKGGR